MHLSDDIETAMKVGRRRGTPVVLAINSKEMYQDNYQFYLSKNKVWLTGYVPPKYIVKPVSCDNHNRFTLRFRALTGS